MKKHLLFLSLLAQCGLILCAASSSTGSDGLDGLTLQLAGTCNISDINEQTGKRGFTKLIRAAWDNDDNATTELLLNKANPHVQEKYGRTALMIAAKKGHTAIAKTLLAMCPDRQKLLTAKSNKDLTTLDYAQAGDHVALARILTYAQNELTFGTVCKTHFSPNILAVILNCIGKEQQSIDCAMYSFTHGDPAEALVKRKKMGVNINLILEQDYESGAKINKRNICIALRYMLHHGIEIRECIKGSNNSGWFNMHHKYLIFRKNVNDKPLLITGSCNFTAQAFANNWENIVIIDDENAIASFIAQHRIMQKAANSNPVSFAQCTSPKDSDLSAQQRNNVVQMAQRVERKDRERAQQLRESEATKLLKTAAGSR